MASFARVVKSKIEKSEEIKINKRRNRSIKKRIRSRKKKKESRTVYTIPCRALRQRRINFAVPKFFRSHVWELQENNM